MRNPQSPTHLLTAAEMDRFGATKATRPRRRSVAFPPRLGTSSDCCEWRLRGFANAGSLRLHPARAVGAGSDTLFGDPTLALLAAAAVLSGHQPDPGRKVASGVELKRVGNSGDDRRCCDRPDTGNSGEPAAGLVVFVPPHDRYLDLLHSPVQCLKFRGQPAKRLDEASRRIVRFARSLPCR